jgi:hypothetical protein
MNSDFKTMTLAALLTPCASSNIVDDAADEVMNILDDISEMLNKCYGCAVALSDNRCPSSTRPGDDVCKSYSKDRFGKRVAI